MDLATSCGDKITSTARPLHAGTTTDDDDDENERAISDVIKVEGQSQVDINNEAAYKTHRFTARPFHNHKREARHPDAKNKSQAATVELPSATYGGEACGRA